MYVRKVEADTNWGKIRVENLTPTEAEKAGYLFGNEARATAEHDAKKQTSKYTKTIVYINGVYYCTADTHTSIWKLLGRFENNVKDKSKYI